MTNITLTRFDCNPRSYSRNDHGYRACWNPDTDGNCHNIATYMSGLIQQMGKFDGEPLAWSFSDWKGPKGGNNSLDHWQAATAVVLEYRTKDAAQTVSDLYDKATALGYAFIIMESLNRNSELTITIIFPLTESVNKDQYARLASVLSEELGQYRAEPGNMAVTHLIHVDKGCQLHQAHGAVIAPRQKIKDTEKLYQNFDPKRFEASSAKAAVHLVEPIVTHDGLFEWAPTAQDQAQRTADELLASIGVKLD